MAPPFRAEHVGSLLRPRRLKDVARAFGAGEATRSEYEQVLASEIARAISLQEEVGLDVITDGEFGRSSWFGFFFERLEGFTLQPSLFTFTDHEGRRYEWMTAYTSQKMRRPHPIAVDEFRRVASLTSRTPKANLPAPSALHFFRGDGCRDPEVYPDLEEWWADVVDIYRAEIRDLAAAGCTYLQLDEVPLAMLCDRGIAEQLRELGVDPDALIDRYIDVTNQVLEARPDSMTVAMHLCRGNFRSRWMASGGYDPIAERLFGGLGVDAFFLEYDTERAGDFSPLRHVTDDKMVVLGLVTTKSPTLENPDDLAARIEEAGRFVPLERLAISPQCGFASVAGGNLLTEEDERRKLQLVVDTARRVWG